MPAKKRDTRNTFMLRISGNNYAKIEKDAKERNLTYKEVADEIIKQHYYNKENKINNTLETYIFEQMQKVDKHLASIAIKNAKDTCTTLAAMLMLIKLSSKGRMDEEEIEEKILNIGEAFYNKHWKPKK